MQRDEVLDKSPENADALQASGRVARSLAVLIVGMHRSGTSALGGVLHMLGVSAPADLIAPDQHNQRGYFEPQSIIDFHERLFAKLGSPSNDPLPVTYAWLDSPLGEAAADELAGLLDEEFGDNVLCLFKDPRICRLAPVWSAALERSGRGAVAVLPLRHPLEVAGSLAAKAGLSRAYSLFMWLQHVVLGERFTREMKRSFTAYDDLMRDWRAVAAKLGRELDLVWPRDMARAGADIDRFLSGELRHHKSQAQALDPNEPLEALCERAWTILHRLVDDPYAPEAMAALDALWAEFEAGLGVFAPLVVSYQREAERGLDEFHRLLKHTRDVEQHAGELDQALRREIDVRDRMVGDLRRELAVRSRIAGEAARARRQMQAEAAAMKREAARTNQQKSELEKAVADAHARLAEAEANYNAIASSTFWKVGHPLRRTLERFPAMRRLGRGAASVVWWTATLKLGRKLEERRRFIAELRSAPPVAPAEAEAAPLPAPPNERPPKRMPERILFVSGEHTTPGHLYRVVRYSEAARAAGFDADVIALSEAHHHLDLVRSSDVVIIWRAAWNDNAAAVLEAAKEAEATIVFDVDDLMFEPQLAKSDLVDAIRSQGLDEAEVADFYARIQGVFAHAQFAFAPTPFLAERLRAYDKPAFVLPNGFDDDVLERSRLAARIRRMESDDGLVRIGYAGGTRTHQKDFAQAVEAIGRVLTERPNCRLVLFRDSHDVLVDPSEFAALDGLDHQIEWRQMVPLHDLPGELARFDVNLAPLEAGNPFCEAKSELKFFEAALVDTPTVASPTEPFRLSIRDGENGFLAADGEGWYRALIKLVDDAGLRRAVGRRAFYDAIADFGPERRAELFLSAMEQISPNPRRAARAFELELGRRFAKRRPRPHVPAHEVVFEVDHLRSAETTVVVPLYNYAGYVVEALESVRAQTVAELDLIVVDDASTDDSLAVARAWIEQHAERFNRVLLIRNTPNAGLGFARNVAFANAETPFVLPLDADNRLRPDCVEKLSAAIRASGAGLAYSHIRQFGDNDFEMGRQVWNPGRLVYGNFIDAMALVRRSAWAQVGGYDHVRYGWEDYDFWCRLAEHGQFAEQVPEVLAEYRVHGSSMLRSETEVYRNKVRLLEDMERRHPWLRLQRPAAPPAGAAPEPEPAAPPTAEAEAEQAVRLERILPLLRCPETGEPLERDGDGLKTRGAGRAWPVRHGRPVLFPAIGEPRLMPAEHISNLLPARAIEMIEATEGLVLNLSAGGSIKRYPHVIEAEVAVFRHTDVVADVHAIPFVDDAFDLVVCMNAFEHYHSPYRAADEILRVLKPGGKLLMSTAFLQPLHEAPWHFFNATRYGVERWFERFEVLELKVTENFNPALALSWQMAEAEAVLRDLSPRDAERLLDATGRDLVGFWTHPETRTGPLWTSFMDLSQDAQTRLSAGFQLIGRKPE